MIRIYTCLLAIFRIASFEATEAKRFMINPSMHEPFTPSHDHISPYGNAVAQIVPDAITP